MRVSGVPNSSTNSFENLRFQKIKLIDRLVDEFGPRERPNDFEVHWICGATGTGKTRCVYEKALRSLH